MNFVLMSSMTTLLDYKTTLAYLAYLGYPGDFVKGLKVSKPRKNELSKGKLNRNVFLAYLFGAPGSGKSSVLKGLISKSLDSTDYTLQQKPVTVVNSLELAGSEKYLVV